MTEEFLLAWLKSDNGQVVHIAVFGVLFAGGFGFPIPEDIPLLLAGVAAAKGIVSPRLIWFNCYFGVLAADQVIYWFGFFFGRRMLLLAARSKFFSSVTLRRIQEVRVGLRNRRFSLIFISRHFFPIRTLTFVSAGALRIPYLEFLIADAIAASVSVSVVLGLGYFLGTKVSPDDISALMHQSHIYLLGLLGVGALIYFLRRRLQKDKEIEESLS